MIKATTMFGKLLVFLLPVMVAADVTTSIVFHTFFTDRRTSTPILGFRGSVIDVAASTTTALLICDLDTDFAQINDLGLNLSLSHTATFGPSSVSVRVNYAFDAWPVTGDINCAKPPAANATTCVQSVQGPGENAMLCGRLMPTTRSWDFYVFPWCSQTSTIPETWAIDTSTLNSYNSQEYRVILTAGLEKLDSAAVTTTASGSEGTAGPSTAASATASAPQATSGVQVTRAPIFALVVLGISLAAAFV